MGAAAGPTLFEVVEPPAGRVSQIRVGRNIATGPNVIPATYGRTAVLTQPAASRLAGAIAADADSWTAVRELPDREAAKTLGTVGDLYEWLNTLGMTRDDLIVGVGGGALTDVVGFVAATYLRGIAVRYVATTVLGAVDAAIGGKTGINVAGKNLAGVFRHPDAVIVDLAVLDRLPTEIRREGSAEAVKAGLIADPSLVVAYEKDGLNAALDLVVPAAIRVKVDVVNADFREAGLRAVLNYGHTIGHAIEVGAGLPHGNAIAIGMVAAGAIAADKLGFADDQRQTAVIDRLGLPTIAPPTDRALLHQLIGLDKKRDATGIRMVLLEAIGKPTVVAVTPEDIDRGLNAVGIPR